ncbi:MAG TPA: hypothetical protein VN688_22440 [Gemmataceae bacterium]|nr:hypothetical protein [Gemmataceae bacterium]
MRRALQRAVGILLATGVVGLARPALAQPSSDLVRDQRTPMATIEFEETTAENVTPAPIAPPQKQPAKLSMPRTILPLPTALPPRGSDARNEKLQLPKILPAKPISTQSASAIATTDQTVYPKIKTVKADSADVLTLPKTSTSQNRSAISWESETKAKPKAKTMIQVPPPTPTAPAKQKTSKPARVSKPDVFASDPTSYHGSTPASADALLTPTPPKKWSQPTPRPFEAPAKPAAKPTPTPVKAIPVALPTPIPMKAAPVVPPTPTVQHAVLGSTAGHNNTSVKRPTTPTPSKPIDGSAIRPVRRWPPAYATQSNETDKGQPGVIVFEDEPAPKPAAQAAATGVLRPIVPENLKRQVMAVCGRKASDVLVERQRDGSVLVKVKVANARTERQLLNKILTIPEMSAPNVHLATNIGP